MQTIKQPFNIEYLNDVLYENQGDYKPFSYDGNANENYTLLSNCQEVCQIACSEDVMIELVNLLNTKISKTGSELFLTEQDFK